MHNRKLSALTPEERSILDLTMTLPEDDFGDNEVAWEAMFAQRWQQCKEVIQCSNCGKS